MGEHWSGKTTFEMLSTLFHPQPATSAAEMLDRQNQKIAVLTDLVFELLREVEALREASIAEAKRQGIPARESSYGRAYWDTALSAQHVGGNPPGDGWPYLLGTFVGWFNKDTLARERFGHPLREILMLRRLGFEQHEIEAYQAEIEESIRNS